MAKKSKAKKIIAAVTGGSLVGYIVIIIGAICAALFALIAALSAIGLPFRAMNELRREAIYHSCAAYAGVSNNYTQELIKSMQISSKGMEASLEAECNSYDTETVNIVLPKICEADYFPDAIKEQNNLNNFASNSDFSTTTGLIKYLKSGGDYYKKMENFSEVNDNNYSSRFTTMYMCMADPTYEYRTPFEYIAALTLAYKFADNPDKFSELISGKIETMNPDGTFDDSKWKQFLDAAGELTGFSDGKIDFSENDVKAMMEKDVAPKGGSTISYFGWGSISGMDADRKNTGIVVSLDELEDDAAFRILDSQQEILGSMKGADKLMRLNSKSATDILPYVTFNGIVYPTILIRNVDTYCATFSDFDYIKVNTGGKITIKLDEKEGSPEEINIFDTTYKLIYYKKTYKIGEMMEKWEAAGIHNDMHDIIFQFLEVLCGTSGTSVYNELSEAYNYYMATGNELVIEYRTSDAALQDYVNEYPTADSMKLMCKEGINILGTSTDAAKLKKSIQEVLKLQRWNGTSGVVDADVTPFWGNNAKNDATGTKFETILKKYTSITTGLRIAQVMFKYGMPFESSGKDGAGASGNTEKEYIDIYSSQKRTYYVYDNKAADSTHQNSPVGYMPPTLKNVNNVYTYHPGFEWGSVRGAFDAAVGTSSAQASQSLTGLSNAGFVDYILQRTLGVSGAFYRLNSVPDKATDQFSTNAYPSVANLYDYASYRFTDKSELLPGDLGFLSPTADDSVNLVGIYMGDMLYNDLIADNGKNYTFDNGETYTYGSAAYLSDVGLREYSQYLVHVFLVCCASNGTNMYSGVNRVVLTSDRVVIPGVADLDFKYFARYVDVASVDSDDYKGIEEKFAKANDPKTMLNYEKHYLSLESEGDLQWLTTNPLAMHNTYFQWQDYMSFSDKEKSDAGYVGENLATYDYYREEGFDHTWKLKYDIAFSKCREALILAKRNVNYRSISGGKNYILFGSSEEKADDVEFGSNEYFSSYGAVTYAIDSLKGKTFEVGKEKLTFSESEATKFVYGILSYGYGVTINNDGSMVLDSETKDVAYVIDKLKAGTFFVWPIQSGWHYVTGFFDYYSEEDVKAVPSLAGRFHYAVDIAPVVHGARLEDGPRGKNDEKWEDCEKYVAMADGEIIRASFGEAEGWAVTVQYCSELNLTSTYKHCNQLFVNIGDKVRQGDVIAEGGGTGYESTGPHLHVEMTYGLYNIADPYANRFAITDLFNYNWSSWSYTLTDEERVPKTHGQTSIEGTEGDVYEGQTTVVSDTDEEG